ncbi:MAG: class I SAM-dependent methyltransferase [Candidatus Bathyarchaeota archaeon]|nr:class I SAM-dependent methyltransferase [Candidatus Bathyarchaeota archaeon]
MSHYYLLNKHVLEVLPRNLDNLTILDVGCGRGEWGFLLRAKKKGSPHLIGVDIWRPHLENLCGTMVYSGLIMADAPHLPLKDRCVDISLACEILEHLAKDAGYKLLRELERVSRKTIIVSTPLNWPQGKIYGNPYERHISEWSVQDLTCLGYNVNIVSATHLPRAARIVNGVRRFLFRLPRNPQIILAYKMLES